MNTNVELSIVLPAYNEAANILAGSLDKVYAFLARQGYTYEVLVVDDGSKDETCHLVEMKSNAMPGFELVKNSHGGKAITVMTGLLRSRGRLVLFSDMDQSTPIEEVERILPKFTEGYDIVIGSRRDREGAPLSRKLMSWGFSRVRSLVLSLHFRDTQCGFKALTRDAVNQVIPDLMEKWNGKRSGGSAVNAGFDVELLFSAERKGLRIAEVEVEWRHVESRRVNIARDTLETLRDIFELRIRNLLGEYG